MRLVVEMYDCDAARIGVHDYRREFSMESHTMRPEATRSSYQCSVAQVSCREWQAADFQHRVCKPVTSAGFLVR